MTSRIVVTGQNKITLIRYINSDWAFYGGTNLLCTLIASYCAMATLLHHFRTMQIDVRAMTAESVVYSNVVMNFGDFT